MWYGDTELCHYSLCENPHDDVIKWKHFSRYWPLCGEFTGHRWIPSTKANDAELWCFLLICAWMNSWVNNREAGLCFTTATWCCRKNFSWWERSFCWKLCCHWLKFLQQRKIAVVRHGRGDLRRHRAHYDVTVMSHQSQYWWHIGDIQCLSNNGRDLRVPG